MLREVTDGPWEPFVDALPPELAALDGNPPPDELPVPGRPPVSAAEPLAVIRGTSSNTRHLLVESRRRRRANRPYPTTRGGENHG